MISFPKCLRQATNGACVGKGRGRITEEHSLVHKPCGRQLRLEAVPENLVEPALVVVEPLNCFIVLPTDVYDYVAGIKDSRIPGPLEVCRTQGERSPGGTPVDVRVPASAYAVVLLRRKTARASSQWKVPL